MVPRVQLPPEIQLAQRLAGNEQVTRDRAVRKLRKYIVARTQRAAGWRSWGQVWARGASRPGRAWREAPRGSQGAGTVRPGWPPNRVAPPRGRAGLRAVLPSGPRGICHRVILLV